MNNPINFENEPKLPLTNMHYRVARFNNEKTIDDLLFFVQAFSCMNDVDHSEHQNFKQTTMNLIKEFPGDMIITESYKLFESSQCLLSELKPKGPRYIFFTDYRLKNEDRPEIISSEPLQGWKNTINFIKSLNPRNIILAGGYLAQRPEMGIYKTCVALKTGLKQKVIINEQLCLKFEDTNYPF